MTPRNTDKSTANKTAEDYGIDDLSSGDETDDDENPRKKIPNWALKSELQQRLKSQYWEVTPVEQIFGVSLFVIVKCVCNLVLLRAPMRTRIVSSISKSCSGSS